MMRIFLELIGRIAVSSISIEGQLALTTKQRTELPVVQLGQQVRIKTALAAAGFHGFAQPVIPAEKDDLCIVGFGILRGVRQNITG